MKSEDKLRKALDAIALGHSQGIVSNDVLIKACENYKSKIGFGDELDYELKVTKSVFDAINGFPQDEEIAKAVIPGQTKMIDGVMYVYTATPNAKTQYDWRVVKKGNKGVSSVGRGSSLTSKQIDDKQKFVNDMFPKDLSSLKVVKQLGGSTGAQLVQDVNGNQYVLKRGTNTNNNHVKSEYLANQMYDALGLRVPDYELYDDNGTAVLLSRYIPMTTAPKMSDYPNMAKGFIADVVMANWDVYQNDNCLVDSAGRIIRVDNGGCLDYRARGGAKNYDGDVKKTYDDMRIHNPLVFSQLSDDDILKQIDDIQSKKDVVVGFLSQSGYKSMADTVAQRIDNLTEIADGIKRIRDINKPNTNPRQLKSKDEMYREFTDEELEKLWKNADGQKSFYKLYNNAGGWQLLSDICKERGFDARPRVLSDDEYWDAVSKLPKDMPMMFRGVHDDNGISASTFASMFKNDDNCFYGTMGIYGEGIYAHVNDGKTQNQKKESYVKSQAYADAYDYAGRDNSGVIFLAYEKDAKIAKVEDIYNEIKNNPPELADTSGLQAEADKIKEEINKTQDELDNITNNTIKDVYTKMHYDEDSVKELQETIDTLTNWGSFNAQTGEFDFPKFKDIVETDFVRWVKANGGEIERKHGQIKFSLPNSDKTITLHEHQFNMQSCIRRRNAFSPYYHIFAKHFEDWFINEHVAKVEKVKNKAVDDLGDKIKNLEEKLSKLEDKYSKKRKEIRKAQVPDPEKGIYEAIYNDIVTSHRFESVGIYAALKGYDGLYQPNGNGSGHGYAIILNRSKLIVKQ